MHPKLFFVHSSFIFVYTCIHITSLYPYFLKTFSAFLVIGEESLEQGFLVEDLYSQEKPVFVCKSVQVRISKWGRSSMGPNPWGFMIVKRRFSTTLWKA